MHFLSTADCTRFLQLTDDTALDVKWFVRQEENIQKLRIGVRANIPDIASLYLKVVDQLIVDCRYNLQRIYIFVWT